MPSSPPPDWYPRRGEVYLAQLDKPRPAAVVSADALNRYSYDVCVVPLTRVQRRAFSLRPAIPAGEAGLRTDSWAKCDQVTTLERRDLHYPPLGRLSEASMDRLNEAIKAALAID